MQIFDFPEAIFFIFQKIQRIPITLPCDLFQMFFWLELGLNTPTNKNFQSK